MHILHKILMLPALTIMLMAAAPSAMAATTDDANKTIQSWPDVSQKAARDMLKKYGAPNGITSSMLVWENNAPWLRTIVHKSPVMHDFPMPHKDVLEQTIPYNMPIDKFDDIAAYDGSVVAARTWGELSARCDKEGANFLAINLANDITQETKTVEQARAEYADALKAMMAGNTPEKMKKFTFNVQRDYKGDSGESIIKQ